MALLRVRELKATNLPAVDKKGKGKSDPYANLAFQGEPSYNIYINIMYNDQ